MNYLKHVLLLICLLTSTVLFSQTVPRSRANACSKCTPPKKVVVQKKKVEPVKKSVTKKTSYTPPAYLPVYHYGVATLNLFSL
ncbi:MAG: hypothetical protein V4651_07630 [Bacteroidota bacterium]